MKKLLILGLMLIPFAVSAELVTITFVDNNMTGKGTDVYLDKYLLDSVDMVPPLAVADTTLPFGMLSFTINVPFGTHLINLRSVDDAGLDSAPSADLLIVVQPNQNGKIPDTPTGVVQN